MKKYKMSTFYELNDGRRFCIAVNIETGECKLIGEDKITYKTCKYAYINELVDYLYRLESSK